MSGLMLCALLVGCGTSETTGSERVIPDNYAALIAEVGPPQSLWLEDNRVTNAELEEAFFAALGCVEETGIELEAEYLGAGDYLTSVRGGSESEVQDQEAAIARCFEKNFDLTAAVYSALYGPTEQDIADARDVFVDCANALGVEGDTYDQVEANWQASGEVSLSTCYDEQAALLRSTAIENAASSSSEG